MPDGARVWVLDTSALIEFKMQITVGDQWQAFKRLEELVAIGVLAMPRQVISEASRVAHPDLPGAWAPGMRDMVRYPLDVGQEHINRVMAAAPDVIDPSKREEDADPYVVAMGLQLQAQGYDAVVVTADVVDRMPIRIAVATACHRLGLPHVDGRAFLVAVGIAVKPEAPRRRERA